MELKNKPRKDFYARGLDMDRVHEMMMIVIEQLSLEESLRLIREIAYDMVSWYSDDAKGIIYRKGYSDYHIEQASVLQTELRTMCDLFAQSVVDGREFEMSHFETYIARYATARANGLEKENERLRQTIIDLEERLI